jgi:hypothetical protein
VNHFSLSQKFFLTGLKSRDQKIIQAIRLSIHFRKFRKPVNNADSHFSLNKKISELITFAANFNKTSKGYENNEVWRHERREAGKNG